VVVTDNRHQTPTVKHGVVLIFQGAQARPLWDVQFYKHAAQHDSADKAGVIQYLEDHCPTGNIKAMTTADRKMLDAVLKEAYEEAKPNPSWRP
jgi:hypothetical protein